MRFYSKNLNYLLVGIFFIAIFSILLIQPIFAIETGLDATASEAGFETGESVKTPSQIVANIVKIGLGFVGTIFLVLIIVSGFQWMTASGNSTTIDTAKKRMINATIGLVVVMGAYAITQFVWLSIAQL